MNRIKLYKSLGFSPKGIFDGGAFIGNWARSVATIFPEAKIILIEPNSTLHSVIQQNLQNFPSSSFVIAPFALSDQDDKEMHLNVWENSNHTNMQARLAGSSVLDHVQGEPSQKIQCFTKTMDSIAKMTNVKPDLIKLDLQGFEKFALAGGNECLKHAEMCIIEFGCLEAYKDRTTPAEIFKIMTRYDFVLYDVLDLLYRQYDSALCGGDFVFVKKNSKLKEHKDFF